MFETSMTEMMNTFNPRKTIYRAVTLGLPGNLVLAIKWTDAAYYRQTFGKPLKSLAGMTASIYRKP